MYVGGGDIMLISPPCQKVPSTPLWHGGIPPLPPVSPLIYDKMSQKGGTIPYVTEKNFLEKNCPF